MNDKPKTHISVLLQETIEYLKIRPNTVIVDGTLGLGGHSMAILNQNLSVKVIGIDQDRSNLEVAKKNLADYGDRVSFYHTNFTEISEVIADAGLTGVDGILLDLGLSSPHIDEADRGFSFLREGPLDMRFDKTKDFTAYDIIKSYSAVELQNIFSKYGEERESRTVAEAIVEARKCKDIKTTIELNEVIEKAKRFKKHGRSAGTNVFQALRIEVNRELEVLERVMEDSIHLLNPGGRMVVISYHSLEDRIVKLAFKKYEAKGKKDKELQLVKFILKKPLEPTAEEVEENSRSRSAKMRVVERV